MGGFATLAEYSYNTAFHMGMGMTPFQVVYGREPPPLLPHASNESELVPVTEWLSNCDKILQQLKINLSKVQDRMKKYVDIKRKKVYFAMDDWVLVKLQGYRQHLVFLRKNHKLSMKYFRPFKILQRVGHVAYKLELPEGSRIHPVFSHFGAQTICWQFIN